MKLDGGSVSFNTRKSDQFVKNHRRVINVGPQHWEIRHSDWLNWELKLQPGTFQKNVFQFRLLLFYLLTVKQINAAYLQDIQKVHSASGNMREAPLQD